MEGEGISKHTSIAERELQQHCGVHLLAERAPGNLRPLTPRRHKRQSDLHVSSPLKVLVRGQLDRNIIENAADLVPVLKIGLAGLSGVRLIRSAPSYRKQSGIDFLGESKCQNRIVEVHLGDLHVVSRRVWVDLRVTDHQLGALGEEEHDCLHSVLDSLSLGLELFCMRLSVSRSVRRGTGQSGWSRRRTIHGVPGYWGAQEEEVASAHALYKLAAAWYTLTLAPLTRNSTAMRVNSCTTARQGQSVGRGATGPDPRYPQ